MLKEFLRDTMRQRNLSGRETARQIGVSHTTIRRMLIDEPIDLDTAAKVTSWLGVSLAAVLEVDYEENLDMDIRILALLDRFPELRLLLEDLANAAMAGQLSVHLPREIANYGRFALRQ